MKRERERDKWKREKKRETERKKEEFVFIRANDNEIQINNKIKSEHKGKIQMLVEFTRSDTLYLNVLSQFNYRIGLKISEWFKSCIIMFDENTDELLNYSANIMLDEKYKEKFFKILKKADLGFISIDEYIREKDHQFNYGLSVMKGLYDKELKNYALKAKHEKYDERGALLNFPSK